MDSYNNIKKIRKKVYIDYKQSYIMQCMETKRINSEIRIELKQKKFMSFQEFPSRQGLLVTPLPAIESNEAILRRKTLRSITQSGSVPESLPETRTLHRAIRTTRESAVCPSSGLNCSRSASL